VAELLVKAKSHWKDSFSQVQIDALVGGELDSFSARSQLGDIIVVRPDEWNWGRLECLPDFIVVKLPGVAEADVKFYEDSLMDFTDPLKPKMLKHRKYQVPSSTIQSQIDALETVLELPAGRGDASEIGNFMDAIIEKTS